MAEESTAGQTPAPEKPEASAIDYAAIDAELRQLGDGVNITTIAERARDWRTQMGVSQQRAAEQEKQLEWVKPLQQHMQNDPRFATHMRDSVESYFNPETGQREYAEPETREVPPELQQVTDPAMVAMQEIKTRMDAMDQRRMMSDLKSEFGEQITPDVEQSIYQRIAETGISDPKQHFIYMKGSEVVAQAHKEGFEDGRSSRSQGAAFGGGATGGGGVLPDVTPAKTVEEMDAGEYDNFAEDRISEIMNRK